MKALVYLNLISIEGMKHHADRHAADIVRLSGVLVDSDKIQVRSELYSPLERLISMKGGAFLDKRVAELRGKGINTDRVVSDLQQFIQVQLTG